MSGRHARWAIAVLGCAAIVAGLVVSGSPRLARLRGLDEHRVNDLQGLAASIDLHLSRTAALPDTTAALQIDRAPNISLSDPSTGVAYEYRVVDDGARYELCATFDSASDAAKATFWSHGAGRTCFTLTPRRPRP